MVTAVRRGNPTCVATDPGRIARWSSRDRGTAKVEPTGGVRLKAIEVRAGRRRRDGRRDKQGIKRQRLYKQAELESLLRLRPSDTPSRISTTKQPTEETSESTKERTEIPLAEDWVPYM